MVVERVGVGRWDNQSPLCFPFVRLALTHSCSLSLPGCLLVGELVWGGVGWGVGRVSGRTYVISVSV